MNKLISNQNGGLRLEWDDIRWMDESLREGFYALLTAFGISPQDCFIISGCTISAGNITAGYIALNGEILKVDAQAIPTPSGANVVYFDIAITYDATGNETMFNGLPAQTYQVRKGVLLQAAATGTQFLFNTSGTTPTLLSVITSKLNAPPAFVTITATSSVSGGGTVSIGGQLSIRKHGNVLHTSIAIGCTISGVVNSFIINIGTLMGANAAQDAVCIGRIETGGVLTPVSIKVAGNSQLMTIAALSGGALPSGNITIQGQLTISI